jgi:hypothetical protein
MRSSSSWIIGSVAISKSTLEPEYWELTPSDLPAASSSDKFENAGWI